MTRFATALQTWFSRENAPSVRSIAIEAGINDSLLTQYRADKRPVTFEALCKLLPSIEKHSSRAEALTLLVAYLSDETPPEYEADLRIYAVDMDTGAESSDTISRLAKAWETRARLQQPFADWWMETHNLMHGDLAKFDEWLSINQAFGSVSMSVLMEDPSIPSR